MRVLTFNVQHGRRPDGVVDTAALARWVADAGADLVALQEVDVAARRSGRADQAAAVAAAGGLTGCFGQACRVGLTGRYGNALLARGGLVDVAEVGLPRHGRREPRALLLATALTPAGSVSVGTTHLSVDPAEADDQLAAALAALGGRAPPRVLAGDLNMRPATVAPRLAAAGLVLADPAAPTFPAAAPRARIDHVAGCGVAFGAVTVLERAPVSDHRGLVVDLVVGSGVRSR